MSNKKLFIAKKIIASFMSAIILLQANIANAANLVNNTNYQAPYADALSDLDKIDNAFLRGDKGNIHENALKTQVDASLKAINNSPANKKLASLKKQGSAKYGNMWPMYVKAAGSKNIDALENQLKQFLGEYLREPAVLPYTQFSKLYLQMLLTYAKKNIKNSGYENAVPFKNPEDKLANDLLNAFPAEEAYKEYKKDAQEEINWRKKNQAKIEDAAYTVARAAISAIGPQNLSLGTAQILLNLELNGKKVLTQHERNVTYAYHLAFLRKQSLKNLSPGSISSEKGKKVTSVLIKNITESIVIAGYLAPKQSPVYSKAISDLIIRSENTIAFSHILGSGFSALLANGNYSALDSLLARYTKMEQNGPHWSEWITLSHYSQTAQNASGKYLGAISQQAQYNTNYSYGNTFTDIALILSEDGTPQSANLLAKYATNRKMSDTIKPFLFGALTGKNSGVSAQKAKDYALLMANTLFGDISPIYEYDIDRALLNKYPAMKTALNKNAIVDKESKNRKNTVNLAFDYLNRAALAGDILLMIWGTIGLAKIGKNLAGLSKSTYTAIKAFKIQNNAKRLAYIRANYAKMGQYISARRSLLRAGNRIKTIFRQPVSAREALKLQNDLNKRNLAKLENAAKTAKQKISQKKSPGKRETAKAELAQAKYEAAKTQQSFVQKARIYSEGYNNKAASYNAQVESFKNGSATIPQQPVFTAGELNFIQSYNDYTSAMSSLRTAKGNFKATSWWNKYFSSPLKNWWNKPSYEDGTLGIWQLETGKGITIEEALHISSPYTPPTISSRLFAKTGPSTADKFYSYLNKHNMPLLSKTLRFINNRATLMGTALMFNYQVATTTPKSLITFDKAFPAATEWVLNGAKSSDLISLGTIKPVATPTVKPASLFDPKIFQTYNTIPLLGGNVVNSLSPKAISQTLKSWTMASVSPFVFTSIFAKNIYADLENKINYGSVPHTEKYLKPTLVAMTAWPLVAFGSPQAQDFLLYQYLYKNLNQPQQISVIHTENSLSNYERSIRSVLENRILQSQNTLFQVNGQQMTAPQIIRFIEDNGLAQGTNLSLKTYNKHLSFLKSIAPSLSISTFERFLKIIVNEQALIKIADLNTSAKARANKIKDYLNSLDYFYVYYKAIAFNPARLLHIPEFASIKNFSEDKILQSIHYLNEIEFAKANIGSLFSSQNLRHSLRKALSEMSPYEALNMAAAIIKAKSAVDELTLNKSSNNFTDIKGCLVSKSGVWDDSSALAPSRIGVSAETQPLDIGKAIVDWIHKSNLPPNEQNIASTQDILDKLGPWVSYMLGASDSTPVHYVQNKEGDVHVYNYNYTVRLRLGSHEIKNEAPHLHLEYLNNDTWYGILNVPYTFSGDIKRDNIVTALRQLQGYFKPAPAIKDDAILDLTSPPSTKTLFILGGPNGSGKTYLYNKILADKNLPFLNQDLISSEQNLNTFEAGRVLINKMDEMIRNDRSFVMESTLSGRSTKTLIQRAKDNGYRVIIVYTFVKSPQESISRVHSRVLEGGHDAPYGNLTDRYYKSRNNFWNLYKDMADDWIMFFNSDTDIIPIASKKKDQAMEILDQALFKQCQPQDKILPPIPAIADNALQTPAAM